MFFTVFAAITQMHAALLCVTHCCSDSFDVVALFELFGKHKLWSSNQISDSYEVCIHTLPVQFDFVSLGWQRLQGHVAQIRMGDLRDRCCEEHKRRLCSCA